MQDSGLGAEADVVKVRRGYARNYLLPRGKAYEVTPAALRQLDTLKKKRAEREANELNEAEELARKIGDQTMVRIAVQGIESIYAEYQKRGGKVHPNGPLQTKPWGTKEFGPIDPNGVCVTFQE